MGVFSKVFHMLGMPSESLEILMGYRGGKDKPKFKPSAKALKYIPSLFIFIREFVLGTKVYKKTIIEYELELKELDKKYEIMNIEQLFKALDDLNNVNEYFSYYVIVVQLVNSIYNNILSEKLKNKGLLIDDLDFSYEEEYNINPNFLLEEAQEIMKEQNIDEKEINEKINKFIKIYGHLAEKGNDFSIPQWKEDKNKIFNMFQQSEIKKRKNKKLINDLYPGAFNEMFLKLLYNKTKVIKKYKEIISFYYTISYAYYRPIFLNIGKKLVNEGKIIEDNDIFYLFFNEIAEKNKIQDFIELVNKRKNEMKLSEKIDLPNVIYTDKEHLILVNKESTTFKKGIPASAGYYSGRTKVIKTIDDSSKINYGDVLIIPHSDIGWTPLIIKSGAVISETGGILSHAAIIAREYDIPTVMGLKNACNLLHEKTVYVDGYTGKVIILS